MRNVRLPAAPLVAVVDRILAERCAGENQAGHLAACEHLGVHVRRMYDWRRPRATVTLDVADRILSNTAYLWFDVWPECTEHDAPETGCSSCLAHYRARLMFSGQPIPRELKQ